MINLNKFDVVKKQYPVLGASIPQKDFEIKSLCELVESFKPITFVEIGTRNAGSTWLISHYLPSNSTIISIDLPSSANNQRNKNLVLGKIRKNGHVVHSIERDSSSAKTIDEVKQILDGKPIDFLFIDGDHSFEGVLKDWEKYHRLVRNNGGLIAFHDIVKQKNRPWQVYLLWRVLRTILNTQEFIETGNSMGIGVVFK